MKTTLRLVTISGATLIMSATGASAAASASDWSDNFYLNADVGGVFQQNATWVGSARLNATFKPGIRGDITVGYNLNDSLAVELESGVICNSIDKVGGFSLSPAGLDFYQIPILADVVYKVPTGNAWSPYLGVGVGGVVDKADFKTSAGTHYCDTTSVFAYQAKAGVDYALTKDISVGIAYEFLGTLNQRYSLAVSPYNFKLAGIYTHSIVASFTWKF